MKKILISLMLIISLAAGVHAKGQSPLVKEGIKKYKQGNYLSTIEIMDKVIKDDPGNALAYYYMAISYVQTGNNDKATECYNSVISLDPNSSLGNYSMIGISQINPEDVKEELPENSNSDSGVVGELYSQKVKDDLNARNLRFLIEKINNDKTIEPSEYRKFEDFTPKNKSFNNKPSGEEIANALHVLSKAGLDLTRGNSYAGLNINPEMMQLSLMGNAYGGNGQNNSMNMLPLLMMMQAQPGNENKFDPQFLQQMITSMMMPSMMDMYSTKNE
jgi:tetratricopeptide (TPR) repeat protein